jgi:PAS domain-containing protein
MADQTQTLLEALAEPDTDVPHIVIEATAPGKILIANTAWCKLTGYVADEIVGGSVGMLHGPLTCRETLGALNVAMNGAFPPRPARARLTPAPQASSAGSRGGLPRA